jgi:hypothetical protein
MTPLGTPALALASKGMCVFPCNERSKEPALSGGFKRATTDPNVIRGWWRACNFNIGLATGPDSGVWVLDVDGEEGEATLRALETQHGALPSTVEVITGKGRHLYFRWLSATKIRNSQLRDDVPGLDWRGHGGYVLAPPSVHPSGRVYAWSVDSTDEFQDTPYWLTNLINKKRGAADAAMRATPTEWETFLAQRIDGSRRGHAIARLTGYLLRRFVDPAITLALVREHNALRCEPPLADEEVVHIVTSIGHREVERRERSR